MKFYSMTILILRRVFIDGDVDGDLVIDDDIHQTLLGKIFVSYGHICTTCWSAKSKLVNLWFKKMLKSLDKSTDWKRPESCTELRASTILIFISVDHLNVYNRITSIVKHLFASRDKTTLCLLSGYLLNFGFFCLIKHNLSKKISNYFCGYNKYK